jgi:hypothetical protein
MGFGSVGFQGYATNYQAKSCVNSTCGTTGNTTCTTAVLTGNRTGTNTTMTLKSINLVSNADNSYMITPASPYIYLFSFTNANGYLHTTITLTNNITNASGTYDFNYNTTGSLTTNFAIPILDSSNPSITTQETYNGDTTNTYYTINPGTYSLTLNFNPPIYLGTATFDSVSIDSNNVPRQSITINS